MRAFFAILATMALAQCASSEDDSFRVGSSPRALVIIGVAESAANTSPSYDLLWRRLSADGAFEPIEENTSFQAETNSRGSVRAPGIPGEFAIAEVDPGFYALDSVFAVIRDDRLNYIANGVLQGPERPAFEVSAGEAVYLGIWQTDIADSAAVVNLWRLDEADLRAMLREQREVEGEVRLRETHLRAVPCQPRRLSSVSQRQIC